MLYTYLIWNLQIQAQKPIPCMRDKRHGKRERERTKREPHHAIHTNFDKDRWEIDTKIHKNQMLKMKNEREWNKHEQAIAAAKW